MTFEGEARRGDMKKSLFLAMSVCLWLFVSGAYATGGVGTFVSVPGNVIIKSQQDFVGGFGYDESELNRKKGIPALLATKKLAASDDKTQIDFSKKMILAPIPRALHLGPLDSTRSSIIPRSPRSSGAGDSPNTAPHFPVNSGYFPGVLSTAGNQNWFYTVASQNGQLTVHLDVPNDPNIDYDLHVYRYNSGNLYTFKSSTLNPTVGEHITFNANNGEIFFILVHSYRGGSLTIPYYLHVEMASPGAGEIDDFPENAKTFNPNTYGIDGMLAMRNDVDWVKFTSTGNNAVIQFTPSNPHMSASLYQMSGTQTLSHIGEMSAEGDYVLPATNGATYYLRIYHWHNKQGGLNSTYGLLVNTFYNPDRVARVLGRNQYNTKIAYTVNSSERLYVNSTPVMERISDTSYSREESNIVLIAKHKSSSGLIGGVRFGRYTSTSGFSVSNAILLMPSGKVSYSNFVSRDTLGNGHFVTNPLDNNFGQTLLYSAWPPERPEERGEGFILDVSTGQIKDFASRYYNGFYNGNVRRDSFSFYEE